MEKNTQDSLSDAQAEEVADIVDALTFELAAELKVLGADVDALGKDVDELAAKVDALDIPEDNIEFTMDVTTVAEVANYGDNVAATATLWQDEDILDLDYTDGDEGDFPTEKAFYQEYGFTVNGAVAGAEFNLDLNTLSNGFVDTDNAQVASYDVFGNTTDAGDKPFEMDTALLEIAYNDVAVQLGDLGDYNVEPYYEEEVGDAEGMTLNASYMGYDVTTIALRENEATEEVYGANVSRDLDIATITGKVYQTRDSGAVSTVIAGQVSDLVVADAVTMGAELAFADNDTVDGIYMTANGEFVASDALTVTGNVEYAGENFGAATNNPDLDGDLSDENNTDTDFTKVGVAAEYVLDENNTVTGSFDYAMPGDSHDDYNDKDMTTVGAAIANTYGDFTNNASVDYTLNNLYDDGQDKLAVAADTSFAYSEATTLTAGIKYEDVDNTPADTFTLLSAGVTNEWNESTTLGAELKYKDIDNGLNYTYLAGSVDKTLNENMTWNTTANYIMGEDASAVEGEGNTVKTSLSVSF
jgi:hypothetical protein